MGRGNSRISTGAGREKSRATERLVEAAATLGHSND
jgi:hypothetical protein